MRISELITQLQFALDNWDDLEVCVVTVTEDSHYAETDDPATPLHVQLDGYFNGPGGTFTRYAEIRTMRWPDDDVQEVQ